MRSNWIIVSKIWILVVIITAIPSCSDTGSNNKTDMNINQTIDSQASQIVDIYRIEGGTLDQQSQKSDFETLTDTDANIPLKPDGSEGDSGSGLGCNATPQCSCTFTQKEVSCVEYTGLPEELLPMMKDACEGDGDTYAAAGCSRKDAIGACQGEWDEQQGCTTIWYYSDSASQLENLKNSCQGKWINP